jgi:DNA-binding MarR family transcriptional regulator
MAAETLPNTITEPSYPAGLRYEELGPLQDRVLRQLPEKERLSPVQVSVLRRVAETKLCHQADLTTLTLTKTAVSTIVSVLTHRGLLERKFDELDARKHVLIIKNKGRELLSKFDQILQAEIGVGLPAENKETKSTEGPPAAVNAD